MKGFDWPVDGDGTPMVLVTATMSEKIGLPDYSAVDTGPVSITRFVKAGTEREGFDESLAIIEDILQVERGKVVEWIKNKPKL